MEKRKRLLYVLRICALPALWVCAVGVGVLTGVRIPCLIYAFTGLKCPGCGLTRAAEAMLRGNFFVAVQQNLLIIPLTFALIIVMVEICRYVRTGSNRLQRFTSRHSLVLVALLLVFMAARNIMFF